MILFPDTSVINIQHLTKKTKSGPDLVHATPHSARETLQPAYAKAPAGKACNQYLEIHTNPICPLFIFVLTSPFA